MYDPHRVVSENAHKMYKKHFIQKCAMRLFDRKQLEPGSLQYLSCFSFILLKLANII